MLHVYIDADGCPVREEVYRVAQRYDLEVTLVANAWLRTPNAEWLELVLVSDQFDAADDRIAEAAGVDDIVITADIPLAARCIKVGARVITPRGRIHTEDSITDAVASRELMSQLRDAGLVTGGPSEFGNKQRSTFLQRLDQVIQQIRRGK